MKIPQAVFRQLASARLVADYALRLGVDPRRQGRRLACDHLGAVLADAALQAGVSYRTVVLKRVERIRLEFPETSTLSGLVNLIERGDIAEYLRWTHPIKQGRFVALVQLVASVEVETTAALNRWLREANSRERVLAVHGVGLKTYDYLCCLVGVDTIAVDRHVRLFVSEAGVACTDYEAIKSAVSFAADLLGMSRRDFDAWIWGQISSRSTSERNKEDAVTGGRPEISTRRFG